MSKISLQPNASGAGTFSIVSPDSNTNRTLTLPDESGAVLSDSSTIDSNNLQPDVYKQDNILGTVSESGGVPTGAIIERGSNANGEFTKFSDGTMICSFSKDWGTITSTGRYVDTSVSYPVTFIASPSLSTHQRALFRDTNFVFSLWSAGVATSSCGLSLFITQLPRSRQWITTFIAFGRWF